MGYITALRLLELLGGDTKEAVVGRLLGETAGRLLRVIARRQRMFGAREIGRATAEHRRPTLELGLFFSFSDMDLLQVAEVFGACHVALLRGRLAVQVPQLDR